MWLLLPTRTLEAAPTTAAPGAAATTATAAQCGVLKIQQGCDTTHPTPGPIPSLLAQTNP